MKRTISVLTLTLLASSLASAGYVRIHNRSNSGISVDSYNSNDYANEIPYETDWLDAGATREFNCATSNGCRIWVYKHSHTQTIVWPEDVYANGVYHLDAEWSGDHFIASTVRFTPAPANGTEVWRDRASLPVSGGGASDCLTTSQAITILNNGRLELDWQGDGNLVLYRIDNGSPVWASSTAGAGGPILGEQTSAFNLNETLTGREALRYKILERIGEGGMARVYRAQDMRLERVVALKFLSPGFAGDPDAVKRFEREAKTAASLDHPNVCPVYEIDWAGDRVFIAMAYLEGKTLAEKLHNGPVEPSAALDIAVQTCRGLAAAHAKNIVHRDIKPANLMIIEATSPQRLVRILDFGIARLTERTQLTQQGLAIGTVSYMAPEQIEGADVDGRADLWALGVVLYRMLAGSLPFERESTRDEVAAILGAEPSPIQAKQHDLPSELEEVVRRALAKDPEKRYQSAVEMLADLEMLWSSVRSEAPERRLPLASHGETAGGQRRLWRLGALAALLVFAALAVWRFGPAGEPERRCRSPEKIDADRRPPHS